MGIQQKKKTREERLKAFIKQKESFQKIQEEISPFIKKRRIIENSIEKWCDESNNTC